MAINIIERAVVPYNRSGDKIVQKQGYSLYAPVADIGKVGMAAFSGDDFNVTNSMVTLKAHRIEKIVGNTVLPKLYWHQILLTYHGYVNEDFYHITLYCAIYSESCYTFTKEKFKEIAKDEYPCFGTVQLKGSNGVNATRIHFVDETNSFEIYTEDGSLIVPTEKFSFKSINGESIRTELELIRNDMVTSSEFNAELADIGNLTYALNDGPIKMLQNLELSDKPYYHEIHIETTFTTRAEIVLICASDTNSEIDTAQKFVDFIGTSTLPCMGTVYINGTSMAHNVLYKDNQLHIGYVVTSFPGVNDSIDIGFKSSLSFPILQDNCEFTITDTVIRKSSGGGITEAELQAAIALESEARVSKDSEIQTAITNEVSRSTSKDAEHDSAITAIKSGAIKYIDYEADTGLITFKTLDDKKTYSIDLIVMSMLTNVTIDEETSEFVFTFRTHDGETSEVRTPIDKLTLPMWVTDLDTDDPAEINVPPSTAAVRKFVNAFQNIEKGEGNNSVVQKSANPNRVLSENGTASGSGNLVGSYGFTITGIDASSNTYTVSRDLTEEEIADMLDKEYSVHIGYEATGGRYKSRQRERYGKVTAVSGKVITVDKLYIPSLDDTAFSAVVYKDSYLDKNGFDSEINTFRVPDCPLIGDRVLGACASSDGVGNKVLSKGGTSEGKDNVTEGSYGHTEGKGTRARYVGHAEGEDTEAGMHAHSRNYKTKALGPCSSSSGCETFVDALAGFVTGLLSAVHGEGGFAGGHGSIVDMLDGFSFGNLCRSYKEYGISMGDRAKSLGSIAVSIGLLTIASAKGSCAINRETWASAIASLAAGWGTIASVIAQTALGKYNVKSEVGDAEAGRELFIVGDGLNDANRSNAFVIKGRVRDADGNVTSKPEAYIGDERVATCFTAADVGKFVTVGENGELVATEIAIGGSY